ncbi:CpaD family pilus assembly lipoprotein [Zavarzinia sp. CC-PAN008]|uniref:CpaD family pilus assembly lipoprotein n=1 Tax=Zavarzinia sp. CC-PAN008 TaxID=3243332 RepID=UPI003F7483C9
MRISLRSRAVTGTLAALIAAVGLAGCSAIQPNDATPSLAQYPKTNKVERVSVPYTVGFVAQQTTLGEGARAGLADAVGTVGSPEALYVTVAGPNDPAGAARAEAIRQELVRLGVPADRIGVASGGAPAAGGRPAQYRVEFARYVVVPPACPDWSVPLGAGDPQLVASNWGCATTTNLGLMVADPRDLLIGQPIGPADATREAAAIDRYRRDQVKEIDRNLSTSE